jgi:DNA-binding transcriptional MerR regulator
LKGCCRLKISEFAEVNNITTKMLRHYDEIGLLKPAAIETCYRFYEPDQSHLLNWIMILKNLDFSLTEIKELLTKTSQNSPTSNDNALKRLSLSRG